MDFTEILKGISGIDSFDKEVEERRGSLLHGVYRLLLDFFSDCSLPEEKMQSIAADLYWQSPHFSIFLPMAWKKVFGYPFPLGLHRVYSCDRCGDDVFKRSWEEVRYSSCRYCQSCEQRIESGDSLRHTEQELEQLRSLPYVQYLETDTWKRTREIAIKRSGSRCQLCGSTSQLNVHHNNYQNKGEEMPYDLVVLCRPCHAKFHDKVV